MASRPASGSSPTLVGGRPVQQRVAAQAVQVALEEVALLRAPQRPGGDLLPDHGQPQRPFQAIGFLDASPRPTLRSRPW